MNALRIVCSLLLAGFGVAGLATAAPPGAPVVVVPIEGTIDDGMAHLVARALAQAESAHAAALVLDVNTPGGLVSSAIEIRDSVMNAKIPTVAYVSRRAWSAGALVTLAAENIEMAPGASIGAAEPIPKTVKTVSALRAEFEATAARRHRNTVVAAAMVDASLDAPPFKKSGQILTLTVDEAKSARIADGIAPTLALALGNAHIAWNGRVEGAAYTWAERLARFATDPRVSGFLLSLGFLGLLIEMQTLHGIAGAVGVSSLALFFGTHIYAGFSNWFVLALALAGVVGILFELHVLPGHGIFGSLGGLALIAAVVLAFGIPFFAIALQAVASAIIITIVCFWLATRILPENAFFARLVFTGAQDARYVSSSNFRALLGASGTASSFLRPAGVASIGGKRVDVLTEGDFLPAGTPIRVTRVEGARIFVAPTSGLPLQAEEKA